MMPVFISCENVCKNYRLGDQAVHAVRDVNLMIREGEFLAIMGRSGSGKSTLLKILGTLTAPTTGVYLLAGTEVSRLSDRDRCRIRREQIGIVFQKFQLLPEYTVWENICMPLYLSHVKPDVEYLEDLMEQFGIHEKADAYPRQLSGGEQQRTAILRAMANRPALLLADEPTGNLDYDTSRRIMEQMTKIREWANQTMVLVTHDSECASYAEQIRVMSDGHLLETGGKS